MGELPDAADVLAVGTEWVSTYGDWCSPWTIRRVYPDKDGRLTVSCTSERGTKTTRSAYYFLQHYRRVI